MTLELSINRSQATAPSIMVELDRVTKSYGAGSTTFRALSDVSIQIPSGGVVALVGPSGSGKSTLLNLCGAVDRVTHGRILVAGQDISDLDESARSRFRNQETGFIFQNFHLIPILTVLENVLLPVQVGTYKVPDSGEDYVSRAKKLIESVGLGPQVNQRSNRLSGGQMQRAAIARALINSPRLLLCDEPTANLDHETAAQVLETLRTEASAAKATVIIATHDPAVVRFCDLVITLQDGKITGIEVRDAIKD